MVKVRLCPLPRKLSIWDLIFLHGYVLSFIYNTLHGMYASKNHFICSYSRKHEYTEFLWVTNLPKSSSLCLWNLFFVVKSTLVIVQAWFQLKEIGQVVYKENDVILGGKVSIKNFKHNAGKKIEILFGNCQRDNYECQKLIWGWYAPLNKNKNKNEIWLFRITSSQFATLTRLDQTTNANCIHNRPHNTYSEPVCVSILVASGQCGNYKLAGSDTKEPDFFLVFVFVWGARTILRPTFGTNIHCLLSLGLFSEKLWF